MRKQRLESALQVSEIFETVTYPPDGTGYQGFIVTYPDGRIENVVIDYNPFNYYDVTIRIQAMHKRYLKNH